MPLQSSYKEAGVDIDAGAALVEKIKEISPHIGGFGGLFPLGEHFLVASTDGVGTKLKLAFQEDRHDTVGIDLVAMCVNDIITSGAKPLFFLDYFATSRLSVSQAEKVIEGIAAGCRMADCALLGGETAEMPDFYREGEYDISGFCVGIVPQKELIDGKSIVPGDKVVGLPSSGLHSNGFSLVRKLLQGCEKPDYDFLRPTKIYVDDLKAIQTICRVKGISHITGGGLTDNIPRNLPKGLGVRLFKDSWQAPSIFSWLKEQGNIAEAEMYRTFNMGIGMVVILSQDDARTLEQERKECAVIGDVVEGEGVDYL